MSLPPLSFNNWVRLGSGWTQFELPSNNKEFPLGTTFWACREDDVVRMRLVCGEETKEWRKYIKKDDIERNVWAKRYTHISCRLMAPTTRDALKVYVEKVCCSCTQCPGNERPRRKCPTAAPLIDRVFSERAYRADPSKLPHEIAGEHDSLASVFVYYLVRKIREKAWAGDIPHLTDDQRRTLMSLPEYDPSNPSESWTSFRLLLGRISVDLRDQQRERHFRQWAPRKQGISITSRQHHLAPKQTPSTVTPLNYGHSLAIDQQAQVQRGKHQPGVSENTHSVNRHVVQQQFVLSHPLEVRRPPQMLHLQLQEHVDPHEAQVVQSPLPKKLKMETQGDRDEGTWHRQWIPIEDNRRVAIQAVPDPVGKEFPRWRSTAAMIHSTAVHRMYTGDTSPKATVSASRALQEGTRRPSEMYCSPCITYAGPQASPMYVMPSLTARNVSVNSNRPNAFRSIAVVAQSTTRSASPPQVTPLVCHESTAIALDTSVRGSLARFDRREIICHSMPQVPQVSLLAQSSTAHTSLRILACAAGLVGEKNLSSEEETAC